MFVVGFYYESGCELMSEMMDKAREVFDDDVSPGDFSLSGLIRVPIDREAAKARLIANMKKKEEYKKKYGDGWWEVYKRDCGYYHDGSYDRNMKFVNSCIYHGSCPDSTDPIDLMELRRMWRERMHVLYGGAYDELERHKNADPRVVELLLQDAIKTGKWKELPNELQAEYRRWAGDVS